METFVGDVVKIILSTGITLTGNTMLLIKYEKPNGVTGHWDAAIVSGAVTSLQYSTTTGDLDVPGTWKVQAYVEFVDGAENSHGKWAEITVFAPIY